MATEQISHEEYMKRLAAAGEPDMVNSPPHYNQGDVECIDAIKAALGEHFPYHCTATAMKYLWRWDAKANPVEDLEKAKWYIDKAIGELSNEP